METDSLQIFSPFLLPSFAETLIFSVIICFSSQLKAIIYTARPFTFLRKEALGK